MEVIFPFAIIFTKSEKPLFFIEVSDIIKKTGCSKNKCFWNEKLPLQAEEEAFVF